ncbi:dual specificity protein phosphatase 10-like isoform X2 [Rhinatrema bivittatum]|uniref:dual specificity protein phosphatase 10-like isoform X2 n=1 Tax=Rhinatrema bivittatum TaxID=194408 RepID=UPI001128694B|nr:dual specificity protein phosphatase 10-like isoform X2 [Rhinatrema bivittatum]
MVVTLQAVSSSCLPMPPSPLEDRIVVLQRPKTLALHLTPAFAREHLPCPRPRKDHHQDPWEETDSSILQEQKNSGPGHKTSNPPKHLHARDGLTLRTAQGICYERGHSPQLEPNQGGQQRGVKQKISVCQQLKFFPFQPKVKKSSSKENTKPLYTQTPPVDSSQLSSPGIGCFKDTMHPLKCGCRGCWRLVHCEDVSLASCFSCKPSLGSLSCFSFKPNLRSPSCSSCSPASVKKWGWLPCTAVLKSLACIACNPSTKSISSSCSFCSSDPIVTYDPRGSSSSCNYEDDYSVRTIWPEELAKKITKSKVHQQAPLTLDCRNLMEYTKSQFQGAMHFTYSDGAGRRRLQQSKLAVLDLITSKESRDSLKMFCPKEQTDGSDTAAPSSDLQAAPASQNLQFMLSPLNKGSEDPLPRKGFSCEAVEEQQEGSSGGARTPNLEDAELSTILPFLFLGNEKDAQDLEHMASLNIGHVINVTTHLPLYHPGTLCYKRLPATDSGKQNLRQYFEEAFEFIEEAHQCGKGVLIHCQAGVSRSATIVIAYLMKHTLMTMGDAYKYVKGKRPVISPNLNFMGQLLEFETDLNSGVTPRILTPKLTGLETEV